MAGFGKNLEKYAWIKFKDDRYFSILDSATFDVWRGKFGIFRDSCYVDYVFEATQVNHIQQLSWVKIQQTSLYLAKIYIIFGKEHFVCFFLVYRKLYWFFSSKKLEKFTVNPLIHNVSKLSDTLWKSCSNCNF